MTREQIESRMASLQPAVQEAEYLQMVLYLLDEGFIEIDQAGGLWEKEEGELCPLN